MKVSVEIMPVILFMYRVLKFQLLMEVSFDVDETRNESSRESPKT